MNLSRRLRGNHLAHRGFTLIELLVSMGILSIIFLITASLLDTSRETWTRTRSRVEQYREPRVAFEALTRRLADAKLHTYFDYHYDTEGLPERYVKESELHFISGDASELVLDAADEPTVPTHGVFFQAPFGETANGDLNGMEGLLNAWGYYVEFGSDEPWAPIFTLGNRTSRYRFRLFEFRQPTEELKIYATDTPEDQLWFKNHIRPENVNVIAENVIALVIQPMDSREETTPLAPDYKFDSRAFEPGKAIEVQPETLHELPSLLKVTMVVVDEGTAGRLQGDSDSIPKELDISSIAPFSNSRSFDKEIEALEKRLIKDRIDHRIFRTIIPIRNAKFTGGRKN